VVDDASTDGTAEVARCFGDLSTEIVSGGRHLGRSGALNAGTRIGTGDVVLFLDSDCAFNTANGLTAHLQALHEGVGVSVSPVRIAGTDFWARYSNEAARRRDSGPSSDTCLAVLVRLADWQIQRPWIPYVCMASAVQLASALAYSRGSAERAPHQRAMIRRVTRP